MPLSDNTPVTLSVRADIKSTSKLSISIEMSSSRDTRFIGSEISTGIQCSSVSGPAIAFCPR
ncbi:hypothetical protein B1748_03790 [Paenibacillus sp. MY03]|nr:hypothetical protein B1748_03790 [Paenibacillus sp. MY03]